MAILSIALARELREEARSESPGRIPVAGQCWSLIEIEMLRSVSVMCHRQSGDVIMHPIGTFKGYGAYMGISPYRAICHPTPQNVGELILDLLGQSGATGYRIKDFEDYRNANDDDETRRIIKTYLPKGGHASTSVMAKKFSHVNVEYQDGQKSWMLNSRFYDANTRCLESVANRRVRHKDGVEALGAAVLDMLADV